MQIGLIRVLVVEFPAPAGEFQRLGLTTALVRELGDNYERYHDFLAAELAKFGKPPNIDEYRDSAAYIEDWARIHDIVRAEGLLRTCRMFRATGRPLDLPLDFTRGQTPLVDHEYRLLSDV